MKIRKAILVPILTVLLLGGVITSAVLIRNGKNSTFATDGYVLEVQADAQGTSVDQLAFSAGTSYSKTYPSSFKYKDISGSSVTVDKNNFIHYNEGSISALNNGVVMDVSETSTGYIDFYQLTKGMVLTHTNGGFEIDNNHSIIPFEELLWVLNDDKFLVSSSLLSLSLGDVEMLTSEKYLEVTYVDKNIVQVAGENKAIQVVATDATITFASGNKLNLGDRVIVDTDGNPKVSVGEMTSDLASGIAISSISAEDWTPPAFKITTIDGEDGTSGESGENGTVGIIGVSGEDGKSGTTGEDGTVGSSGSWGNSGSTGGTSTVQPSVLGTIRVTDFGLINISSAEFALDVIDEDNTLTQNTGLAEIREVATNRLVWSENFNVSDPYAHIVFAASGDPGSVAAPIDCLSPNTEYELIIKNGYSITFNDTLNTGTKTFVDRIFTTPSEGLVGTVDYVSEDSMVLDLEKSGYSEAESYAVAIELDGVLYRYPASGALNYNDIKTLNLNLATITGLTDLSNKDYKITIYSSTSNADGAGWDVPDGSAATSTDEELYVGESMNPVEVKKSTQVITGTTLKQKPAVSGVNATLTNNGYYELSALVDSDPDNAITMYKYTIKDNNGTVLKVLESSKSTANWYYGQALPSGEYTVNLDVTYFDNAKYATLPTKATTITVTSATSTAIRFSRYKPVNGNFVNELDQTISATDGVDAVSATRIWGDLVLVTNGVEIDTSKKLKIKIASSGDSTYTIDNMEVSINALSPVAGNYYIPIKLLGLRSDTTYTFTVFGTTKTTVSNGATSNVRTNEDVYLGTATVRTPELEDPGRSDTYSIAAFGIEPLVNSDITDAIFGFKLYQGNSALNSTSANSPHYENRAIARAVEFTISSVTGTRLAVIVKDLYDMTEYVPYKSYISQFENPSTSTTLERNYFFNSPLVSSADGSLGGADTNGYAVLYKNDFIKAGFTEEQLATSTIVVEATALYDYSYGLRPIISAYGDNFLASDAVNYNRMPLDTVVLKSAGSIVGRLNYAEINLGEKAPVLHTPANQAVEVSLIKNGSAPINFIDQTLDGNTDVGFKVQAVYESTGQETEIEYYCFTMDSWKQYCEAPDTVKTSGKDLIYDYELPLEKDQDGNFKDHYVRDNNLIKFKAIVDTSKYKGQTSLNVPALYVIIADPNNPDQMNLVNQCKKTQKDADNDVIDTWYEPLPSSLSQYPVIYVDSIERGNCYMFGMTLKTMYGVKTTEGGEPQPWLFPYDINTYNGSQIYFGDTGMQRSEGTDIYCEIPQVAAYLDHNAVDTSSGTPKVTYYYNYIVYDPDDTLGKAQGVLSSSNLVVYAGSTEDMMGTLANEYMISGVGDKNAVKMLSTSISGSVTRYTKENFSTAPQDVRNTVDNYFQKNGNVRTLTGGKGSVYTFTVAVTDNDQCPFHANFYMVPFKVWIGSLGFVGQNTKDPTTTKENAGSAVGKPYAEIRITNDNRANSEKHFARETVFQLYDRLLTSYADGVPAESLEAKVVAVRGGGLDVSVTVADSFLKEHLAGIYYEVYTSDPNVLPKPVEVQYGFYRFDQENNATDATIMVERVPANEDIYLKCYAVYGTGQIGLNIDQINTSIHRTYSSAVNGNGTTRNAKVTDFYAFTSMNLTGLQDYVYLVNTNGKINFTDHAFGSIFQVAKVALDPTERFTTRLFTITQRNGSSTGKANRETEFTYSDAGSVSEEKIMFFEGLKETPIKLVPGPGSSGVVAVAGYTDTVKATVPAVEPAVSGISNVVTTSLHEDSVMLAFSKKVVESMVSSAYSNEVWAELYVDDGGVKTKVDNIENRFFDISLDGATQYRNNPVTVAGYSDDWTFRFEDADVPADETLSRLNIRIKNLEPDKNYYLKLYCKDPMTGDKVYFLDNFNNKGEEFIHLLRSHWTNDIPTINIGSDTYATSKPFVAEFKQDGYETQTLNANYSLNYTGGYILDYSIRKRNGAGVIETVEVDVGTDTYTLNMPTLAKMMGYNLSETVSYHYYDYTLASWQTYDYTRYYRETIGGTKVYFDQSLTNPTSHTISFTKENGFLFTLPEGEYYLAAEVKDLYGGKTVELKKDNSLLTTGTIPMTEFYIPSRSNINVSALVSYTGISGDGKNATANVTVSVYDNGYRLGYKMTNGDVEYGNFVPEIMKLSGDGITWTKVSAVTVTPALTKYSSTSDYTAMKGTQYTIQFAVHEGDRYRLVVNGVDLTWADQSVNKAIYDSETAMNTTVKDRLTIKNLSKPVFTNIVGSYDNVTKNFSIIVKNGSNLETINRISYTLYNMDAATGAISKTVTSVGSFTVPNSKGIQEMTIPVGTMISDMEKENSYTFEVGDILVLTVEFQNGSTYLTEETFNFMFK